jgi:hypothetical protein
MERLSQIQGERTISMLQAVAVSKRTYGCTRATLYNLQRRLQQTWTTQLQENRRTLAALRLALIQEWGLLPRNLVRRYVCSMRQRITACISSNGGHTRY